MPPFSLALLGPPAVFRGSKPLKIHRRKSRALLYYLAAEPDAIPRDRLYEIFWPDSERPAAQQSLRTALHGLRSKLDDSILSKNDTLVLSDNVNVDTRALSAAVEKSPDDIPTLETVLAAVRGRFLESFYLPDSTDYESWQTRQEEYFRRTAIRGQVLLSRHHENTGDYHAALDALERALEIDPFQEDLQRQALLVQFYAGDRAGAIRRYDRLRHLLDDELGMPPMAETRALYDAIITDKLELPTPAAVAPAKRTLRKIRSDPDEIPFIGREEELAQMAAAAAEGKFLLIEGGAGIGKTRLAQTYIRRTGAAALSGAAQELGQNIPLGPILEAVRSLQKNGLWDQLKDRIELAQVWKQETARVLPNFFPEHRPEGEEAAFSVPSQPQDASDARLWESLSRFLEAVARETPLVIFLDDLQWTDSTSLALLDYLLRSNPEGRITYLACTRPPKQRSAVWRLLQTQARQGRLVNIPLKRLEPAEIRSMFSDIPETEAMQLTDWLVRSSEGNPFVLSELIRDLHEDGILRRYITVDATRLDPATVVPQSVYSIIQAGLAKLSDTARRLLDAAVVVGREFEPNVAQTAAGISELAALDALDELSAAGLVIPGEDVRYRFAHILISEVAWMESGEPRHRLMHRRVAEVLETLHRGHLKEEAGVLAFHFAEGRDFEKAAHYAFIAAQNAEAVHAWAQAAELYERALVGAEPEARFDIHYRLSHALYMAGQATRSSEAARVAIQLAEAAGEVEKINMARIQYARSLITQGRLAEIVREVQPVLQTEEMPYVIMAEILWGTAHSMEGADLRSGQAHLENAIYLAEQSGESHFKSQAMFELGNIAAQQGDLARANRLFQDALNISEDPNFNVLLLNNLAYHQLLAGDPAAEQTGLDALAQAEEFGMMLMCPYIFSTLGEIALDAGDIEGARAYFEKGLALARQMNNPERVTGLTANLGLAAAAAGDSSLALLNLSKSLGHADDLGLRHMATRIRIWLAPLAPPDKAVELLDEAAVIARESGREGLLEEIGQVRKQLA